MKTWNELTEEQKELTLQKFLARLLHDITSGHCRFDDSKNGDNLQETIDAAIQEADSMRTPWFAHEYIIEARYTPCEGHDTEEDDGKWPVREILEGMARCQAEDAIYLEDSETATRIPKV